MEDTGILFLTNGMNEAENLCAECRNEGIQDYRQREIQEDEHIILTASELRLRSWGATRVLKKLEGHIKDNQHSRELGTQRESPNGASDLSTFDLLAWMPA